jgi:hypothetical protein
MPKNIGHKLAQSLSPTTIKKRLSLNTTVKPILSKSLANPTPIDIPHNTSHTGIERLYTL